MKKSNFKILSIAILALAISLTSCNKNKVVIEIETATELKISTPQPSPLGKISQRVGLTDIDIAYSRPGVKGRTIFGELVAFGKIWRTGANSNTKITFSSDVMIDGQSLKAGSYGLYSIPNKDTWEIIFYSEADKNGVPRDWNDNKIAAKTSVKVGSMPMNIETFTIAFNDVTSTSTIIGLLWEKTYVGIKIEVPTDQMVSTTIDAVMAASPKAGDYYNAAIYYSQQDKDLKKANEWMEKAMSMIEKPGFWQLRQQSLIYAKIGETEKAIATAKKSLEGAKAAKNEAYIKMNSESLKEWGAM
ncbi:MAG: DUF2911 domain-containing protein [Polaribacter sp.]|nr:DUF2911 domain-containing protein [Polaribacter sp.]